ncbi:MAG: hypothetical protein ACKOED_09035 [Aestuariivirga sp.]|uniref:hypothetical protein n=1 Tax=Aestuariivirga sp. TaxID=2650926 RepID=UPI0038D002E4
MRASTDCAVIAFPMDRVRPAAAQGGHGAGEVVMFTGVRVERLYDLAERLPAARTGSTQNGRRGEIEYY